MEHYKEKELREEVGNWKFISFLLSFCLVILFILLIEVSNSHKQKELEIQQLRSQLAVALNKQHIILNK